MLNQGKLMFYAGGIFVCYFYYGILQEQITKGDYIKADGTKEIFTYTLSLVFVQCVINAIFAFIVKRVMDGDHKDGTSHHLYAICSLSYLGAMLSSNMALQWVSYPTQVLGKSIKPIPVMILGVFFAHKRYHIAKYIFVLFITLGVAMFMYKDPKHPGDGLDTDHTFGMGEMLLIVSLALDGVTGALQSRMKIGHDTKSFDMMLQMNVWSILWLAIALATGEAFEFYLFCNRNPHVLLDTILFGLTSALGQHFIFLTVTNFGPLSCSVVTTTRKFFTILGSVLIFGHPMLTRQWIGTAMVFIGLAADSTSYGKELKPADTKHSKPVSKPPGTHHHKAAD